MSRGQEIRKRPQEESQKEAEGMAEGNGPHVTEWRGPTECTVAINGGGTVELWSRDWTNHRRNTNHLKINQGLGSVSRQLAKHEQCMGSSPCTA